MEIPKKIGKYINSLLAKKIIEGSGKGRLKISRLNREAIARIVDPDLDENKKNW